MKNILALFLFMFLLPTSDKTPPKINIPDRNVNINYNDNRCFECVVVTPFFVNKFFAFVPNQYAADEYARTVAAKSGDHVISTLCRQAANGCY